MLALKVFATFLAVVAVDGMVDGDDYSHTNVPVNSWFSTSFEVDCGSRPITRTARVRVWDDDHGEFGHGDDDLMFTEFVWKPDLGSSTTVNIQHQLPGDGFMDRNVELYYIFENFCESGDYQIRFGDVRRAKYELSGF